MDYLAVMSYQRQIAEELGWSDEKTYRELRSMAQHAVRSVGIPERVLMKVQGIDWTSGRRVPIADLERSVDAVMCDSRISVAVVPGHGTLPSRRLLGGPYR